MDATILTIILNRNTLVWQASLTPPYIKYMGRQTGSDRFEAYFRFKTRGGTNKRRVN